VEPYLAGTSTRLIDETLSDRPHRTLALGVSRAEQRRYGTPEQHDVLLGLDAAGLRRSISEFLRSPRGVTPQDWAICRSPPTRGRPGPDHRQPPATA
jgi:hypothetical protein